MDLGMAPPTAASAIGRRRKAQHDPESEMQKVVTDMAKLCLSSAQNIRAMKPILFQTIRVSADGEYSMSIQEATKLFVSESKKVQLSAMGDSQVETYAAMGLPHHHVFNSCMIVTKKLLETMEAQPEHSKWATEYMGPIQELVDEVNALTSKQRKWDTLETMVKHMRLCKSFDRRHKKIEIHVVPGTLAQQIVNGMFYVMKAKDPNFKVLQGQAPRSGLERQIQGYLDGMGEKVDKDD